MEKSGKSVGKMLFEIGDFMNKISILEIKNFDIYSKR